MSPRLLALTAAPVFVLIWSTGFIVARLVTGHIGPLTFLAIRFALAAVALAAIAAATGARWPREPRTWRNAAIAGVLIQAVYLGGIFWAVSRGLPAAVAALIAGAQPLFTGLVAGPLLGERVSGRRWGGILVGMAGVVLVIAPRLQPGDSIPLTAFTVATLATVAITAGTFWQKRIGSALDITPGTAIQYAASAPLMAVAAALAGEQTIVSTLSLWLGLAWSVLGLSVGAVGLFFWMIKQGAVTGVATLLFLVPPVTAVLGYGFFGDTLAPLQLAGMALAALGVAVASRA